MRKQIVTVVLAGSVGLAGAALLAPGASAASATPSPSAAGAVADRLSAIKDALKGLVSDDTLTQAQADKVAQTLADKLPARGPGGRGRFGRGAHLGPAEVAAVLGITPEELRTQREAGTTLTQIAATKGISKADLIDKLVAAAKADLAADVKAGKLTQAQSDSISKDLTARVTEQVDRVGGPEGHGGPGGPGRHGDHDGDGPDAPPASGTPSAPAAPSSTTTTGSTVSA